MVPSSKWSLPRNGYSLIVIFMDADVVHFRGMKKAVLIVSTGLALLTLNGCALTAVGIALNLLSAGGGAASSMNQTGPMAESFGQREIGDALGRLDNSVNVDCTEDVTASPGGADSIVETSSDTIDENPSSPPVRGEDTIVTRIVSGPEGCTYRTVCMGGMQKPLRMLVCPGVDPSAPKPVRAEISQNKETAAAKPENDVWPWQPASAPRHAQRP